MMRWRQCALLVPSLLRALPRAQLAAGVTATFTIVWLLSADPGGARTIVALQYAALALSLAVASILDDPAAATVAAAPPTLLLRRILTIALVLPAVLAAWSVLIALSGAGASLVGAITLQMGAIVILTLALAVALARGGTIAGSLVVLMFLSARPVAPEWALVPDLGDWRWDVAWTGLGAAALLALLIVSRDPAQRSSVRLADCPVAQACSGAGPGTHRRSEALRHAVTPPADAPLRDIHTRRTRTSHVLRRLSRRTR